MYRMGTQANIVLEQHDQVMRLTMNRPASLNSLSTDQLDAMRSTIADLAQDRSIHAIVIAGAGANFCSGHDLRELTDVRRVANDGGLAYFDKTMRKCAALMMEIIRCPKPVIAEVQGIATGVGAQLVSICDLAVAEEGARFSTPGVHIGLFCSAPMVPLSRNMPRKHLMEMLLTGDMYSAERARELGLINRVVPAGELTDATLALAAQVAKAAPSMVMIGKEAFYRQAEMSLEEAFEYAAGVMAANMMEADADEGISAFLEKRQAKWQPL
jgi:enoyl-CoA hydratase/carnithine racemase